MVERTPVDEFHSVLSRVCDSSFGSFPVAAQEAARHSFLDWIGCAVAGSVDVNSQIIRDALDSRPGDCTVIGSVPLNWRDAVIVNGVHGHALDFDDMLPAIQGHASAAVFPALFVLAGEQDSSLADVLSAYVAGVEVAAWIAKQVMPEHYDAGWHATGTVGTFAAAAASAHLMNLDESQWISSLDFAATQAAGLRELFGTAAKPLHAGRAAEAGLLAAKLAQAGAQSGGQGLSGTKGFISLHHNAHEETTPMTESWAVEGTLYKTYASCYMTQAAIDAALHLGSNTAVGDIQEVRVSVSPKLSEVCAIADPHTENEAKFSLHATVALALLGKDLSENSSFSPEALGDQDYRSLRQRVSLDFDESKNGYEARTDIHIKLHSGEVLSAKFDRGVPESDLDKRRNSLSRKFESLASPIIGHERTHLVRDQVLGGLGSLSDLSGSLGHEQLLLERNY